MTDDGTSGLERNRAVWVSELPVQDCEDPEGVESCILIVAKVRVLGDTQASTVIVHYHPKGSSLGYMAHEHVIDATSLVVDEIRERERLLKKART